MDGILSSAKKEALVEIVKLAQTRGIKGSKGGWKEFLNVYDKKIGASLSDPSRRPADALIAFLKTFSEENLKCFEKVLQCHSNRDAVVQFQKDCPDAETPEQMMVRLTLEHPQYSVNYSFPSHEQDWLVTKGDFKPKSMKSTKMVAVDCEMVLCEDGTEALVRVCVVDRDFQVRLDEFVNPRKLVADYRTEITGVSAKDLDGITCSLADVQRSMKKILSHGTILVGHSLHNDLQALKLDHARVIDTSYIFKYEDSNKRPSLNNLCKSVLGFELRKMGSPHNCVDDARAAMKLILAKIKCEVDTTVPFVGEEVQENHLAKLLVHRIPIHISSEDLQKIIPGEFIIQMKADKKAQREKYSAFTIFKNQQEANEAFEKLEGILEKDSSGRPQKLISIPLDTGKVERICVCKMSHGDSGATPTSNKRTKEEEASTKSKKVKTDPECEELKETPTQCQTHLTEIERLKKELGKRDQEISNLNKIIVALIRKQGLVDT